MRNSLRINSALIIIALALIFVPSPSLARDVPESVSIKVRETALRAKPKAWSPGIAGLAYGSKVTVLGSEEGWFKVKTTSGKEGYLHPSAVTDRPVIISSTSASVGKEADPSQVVLAGKGFSKEIEKEYASLNPSLKYSTLNQIERMRISDSELVEFMSQGMLGKGRL